MRKCRLLSVTLLVVLALTFTGCSTAWVTTLDSVLAAAAPALINILQIVALSKGTTVNSALQTKINADAAAVKSAAADFAKASGAAGPGACSQLQADLTTYQADLPAVLALAQVANVNTQNKIETLSALIVGVFGSLEPLIPSCSAPAMTNMRATLRYGAPPLPLKNFVGSYNAVLTSKVNDPAVDAKTKALKLHYHSKPVRLLSFGFAQ